MITSTESEKKRLEELEEAIAEAMKKVKASRETKLSQYIPWDNGYMHHLSFLRLKKDEPKELKVLIKKHILEKDNPEMIVSLSQKKESSEPKSYLKQKRVFELKLRRVQIQHIVSGLEKAGPEYVDIINLLLAPLKQGKPSLEQVQKLIMEMLKDKKYDRRLIREYEKLLPGENAHNKELKDQ